MFYNKALLLSFIRCTLQSDAGKVNWCTYIHNEKVQPPVVGEVFLETVGDPLQTHFQDEDVGEDLVCVFKHHFDHFPLFNVNVFKCLLTETQKKQRVKSDAQIKPRKTSEDLQLHSLICVTFIALTHLRVELSQDWDHLQKYECFIKVIIMCVSLRK